MCVCNGQVVEVLSYLSFGEQSQLKVMMIFLVVDVSPIFHSG